MSAPVADFNQYPDHPYVVFAASQGIWGNALVVRQGNVNEAENTFDIELLERVILPGTTSYVLNSLETYTVSREHKLDGFRKQLFLENRINNVSDLMWVINNPNLPVTDLFPYKVTSELLGTGDGVVTSFSGTLAAVDTFLIGKDVQRGTVAIRSTASPTANILDSGNGKLAGPGVTGTINYATGAYTLNFTAAPAMGQEIRAAYFYSSSRLMSGGNDGALPTYADYATAIEALSDPGDIQFQILIEPTATHLSVSDRIALQKDLTELCETRGDCFFAANAPSEVLEPTDLLFWRKNEQAINSSYGALYAPNLVIRDKYNDLTLEVPPAGFMAGLYAAADAAEGPHQPAAGADFGQIAVLGVSRKYTKGDYDTLYPAGINLIKDISFQGPTVMGQRTMQNHKSYTRNVHVRRNLLFIRASLTQFLKFYQFKLNTPVLREQVEQRVTSFLRDQVGGLKWFDAVCDDTNNDGSQDEVLYIDIAVLPFLAIENIVLRATITDSAISIQEIGA